MRVMSLSVSTGQSLPAIATDNASFPAYLALSLYYSITMMKCVTASSDWMCCDARRKQQ